MRIRSSNILYKKIWHNIEIHLLTNCKISQNQINPNLNDYIKLKHTEKELQTELESSCKVHGNGTTDSDGSHGTWNASIVNLMVQMIINSKGDIFVGFSIEWGGLHWMFLSTTWCILGYRLEIPIRSSGALILGGRWGCCRRHGVEGCVAFILFSLEFWSRWLGFFFLLFPVCETKVFLCITKWTTSKHHKIQKSFFQKPGKWKCHIQQVSDWHTTGTDLFMQYTTTTAVARIIRGTPSPIPTQTGTKSGEKSTHWNNGGIIEE